MKKKKMISILLISLVIVFALGITSWATLEYSAPKKKMKDAGVGEFYVNKEALESKDYIFQDKTKKELIYKETYVPSEEREIDIYMDENDSEYRFDEFGNLVGIYNNESQDTIIADDNVECLSAEEAIEIATKDAEKNYGEIFEKFQYASYTIQDYGPIYVYFYIYHGADNFVLGESLIYSINESGGVSFSTLANVEEFKEFDETLLDGLTRSNVEESMRIQLFEKYGAELLSYEFGEIQLTRIEDHYCLRSAVTLHFNDYLKKEVLYFELG